MKRTITITAFHVIEYEGDAETEEVAGAWFHKHRHTPRPVVQYAGAPVEYVGAVMGDVSESPQRTAA